MFGTSGTRAFPTHVFKHLIEQEQESQFMNSCSRPHVAFLVEAPPIETCPERILRKHCESGCRPLSIHLEHYRLLRGARISTPVSIGA